MLQPRRTVGTSQLRQVEVFDQWQYVSIEESLQTFLSDPNVFNGLRKPSARQPSVIAEYADAENFRQHPIFSDPSKTVVAIQAYNDDIEVRVCYLFCNVSKYSKYSIV